MTRMTRRHLLTTGAAATATTLLTNVAEAKPYDPMPKKWDETVDVLVVGSGFAGLAAACQAAEDGAKVLVVEKMRTPGGNSIINGGIFGVPRTPMQLKMGITDSPELLAEDIIREGGGLNNPEKVKLMASRAFDTWQWTVDKLGVEYVQERVAAEGGHSVPRCAVIKNGSGSGIVTKQLEYAKKLGVEVRLRTYVDEIIRDADGRVKGLKVYPNYSFPKAPTGEARYIRARRAVVLCHGGFGADVNYRMKFDPKLTARFDTTNQPGATSELWRESSRIGCNMIQSDWIQCGPWNSPEEKGMGIALYFAQGSSANYGVWINCKTGKRFINELANRKVRADAIIEAGNRGEQCIALAPQWAVDLTLKVSRPGLIEKMLERNVVHKFETLAAVAEAYHIPLEALRQTLKDYNDDLANPKPNAEGKALDRMGRYFYPKARPLNEADGPWYVSIMSPKVHHTMGGIETGLDGHAIDVKTDKPIPGLFAAGESTGGVHGAVRLGSCATLDCLVNGRIAGAAAAKETPWA